MGSIRVFNGKEFETYQIWRKKRTVKATKKAIKRTYGNKIKVRITKSPRHKGYDLYTYPDEREWHKLKRRRK